MGDSKKQGNPEDTPPHPTWIDIELIQQALNNDGGNNLKVSEISVGYATAPGDNYGSTIYRVKAKLTNGDERSFIVKEPAPGADMTLLTKIFRREAAMLSEVLPQMQSLLEEAAPGRFPPLAPRCFHHGSSPVEFIVLEDLAPAGYKMADRTRGLGLRHSLAALRTLARFHAASHALLRRRPELAKRFDNNWREIYGNAHAAFEGAIQAAVDACRLWPSFEECSRRLQKFKAVAMDTFATLNDPKPGAFNVITHGDFWVNNMLYRYEHNIPMGHRAVDLQLSHVSSPAIDLLYFLSGSLCEDVHEHYQDLLLREYHFELTETMKILGLQAPTLESLLASVEDHGSYALYIILLVVPIIKVEKATEVGALVSGDFSDWRPFEQPRFKRWLQRVLPDCVRRGWLPA
ncbi:hypothetical protein R5R35_007394 [Gryllus longicercus]|uniref:CHK kinase-like domain-containing protein n=1 Tax=Gryllus longicercus TaxID=2509291 RepID=A0AAN9VI05_9ORTH